MPAPGPHTAAPAGLHRSPGPARSWAQPRADSSAAPPAGRPAVPGRSSAERGAGMAFALRGGFSARRPFSGHGPGPAVPAFSGDAVRCVPPMGWLHRGARSRGYRGRRPAGADRRSVRDGLGRPPQGWPVRAVRPNRPPAWRSAHRTVCSANELIRPAEGSMGAGVSAPLGGGRAERTAGAARACRRTVSFRSASGAAIRSFRCGAVRRLAARARPTTRHSAVPGPP